LSPVLATGFPLYHLATLAVAAYKLDPGYIVLDKNYYHFLGSILHILTHRYPYTLSDQTIPGHSFEWKKKANGSWGPFLIFKTNQFTAGPLEAKFAEKQEDFEHKVCPPFLPLVEELISDFFQMMIEEEKRETK